MNKPAQLNMPREIDLELTTPTECDECKCQAFQQATMLRKVSALLSGNGEEGFMPVMVFACVKCGHINNEFIPVEIRPKPAMNEPIIR